MTSTISRFRQRFATVESLTEGILSHEGFITENGHQTTIKYMKIERDEFLFIYGTIIMPQLVRDRDITFEALTPEIMAEYEEEIGHQGRIELLSKVFERLDGKAWADENPQPIFTEQDKIKMIQLMLDEPIEPIIHKVITNGLTDEMVEHNQYHETRRILSDLLQSYQRMIERIIQHRNDE